MPDDGGGIYLGNDTVQKLNGDLFSQQANAAIADQWHQQATAAIPQMMDTAAQQQSVQQAVDDHAKAQAQNEANAAAFQQSAAPIIDGLAQHLGNAPATPVPDAAAPPPSPAASVDTSAPADTPAPSVPPPSAPAPPPPPVAAPAPPVPAATAQPATPTTAGLSGGGDLSGRVGAAGQAILSAAADTASWLGDQGQKALQAVLITEGGLAGARGDKGQSAGPLQFYTGGQLANFAQQHGISQDAAMRYVEANPEAAIQWAIGTPDAPGYLGQAILAGQKQGLQGADLATYAQQHGQVSVSPERAGQNWQSLFGQGADAITGAARSVGDAVQQVARDPSSILDAVKPFLGDKYAWGGKSPTTGFDCSGLAGYLTTGQPESTTTLYGKSAAVTTPQPGDLVFYNMGSSDPHMQHVAVYLGDGKIVQSGGNQANVNIGNANQAIGSPPEFRRVGDGGMPAQAAVAQQQGIPAEASAAAPPADQTAASTGSSWLDPFKNAASAVGGAASAVGSTVQSGLQGLFGGAPDTTGGSLPGPTPGGVMGSLAAPEAARQQNADNLGQAVADAPGAAGTALPPLALQQPTPGSPLARSLEGQQLTAPEALAAGWQTYQGYQAARDQATANLNPARDVPVLGGALNSLTDPLMATAVQGGVGLAAGHLAAPVATDVADAAGNVLGGAQAGSIGTRLATTLGGAAAGGGATYAATDPNDPNRILKIGAGALAGGAAAYGAGSAVENAMAGEGRLIGQGGASQLSMPGVTTGAPPTGAELFKAYHTSNVISGGATMTHVAVNSILAPAWSFLTRGAADLVGGAAGAATGGRIGLDTGFSRVQGSGVGVAAGLADSGAAFARSLADHFTNVDSLANRTTNPIGSALLQANSVAGSLHGAFQSAAQMVIEKTELGRMAGEQATQLGLKGADWTAHVADAIANPAGAMADQAQATAQRAVLRGDLGTLASKMQDIANVPVLGNTLFPVVKIAANSMAQGIESSPLGLLGTATDVARATTPLGKMLGAGPYGGAAGFAGNGIVSPLTERLTNNLAGTAVTAWLASKALDGSITGAGPPDLVKKAQMIAQGWQPNSIYLPGRGYIDYHIMGKLAIPLALAGSYADAVNYGGPVSTHTSDPAAIAGQLTQQMGAYLQDQTGLRTIGQLYDAFHKQGATAGSGLVNAAAMTLGGFVPQSAALASVANATDPLVRKADPNNIGQALSLNIPGLREQVPPKLDTAGNTIPNPKEGLGALMPRTGVQTAASQDPTLAVLSTAGIAPSKTPTSIQVAKAGSGYPSMSVDLTPAEQVQYEQARVQALKDLGVIQYANDPSWGTMGQAGQRKILNPIIRQADAQAAQQIAAAIPSADMDARIQANATRTTPRTVVPGVVQTGGAAAPLSLTPVPLKSLDPAFPFGKPTNTKGALTADGLPDDTVSPGAVVTDIRPDQLHDYSLSKRLVPAQTKAAVYDAYGVPGNQRAQMVIDHRVPRGLGGSDDPANLAPQPKDVAAKKDIVEVYLMGQVTAGKMALADAQRASAYEWPNTYQQIPDAEKQRIQQHMASLSTSDQAALLDQ